MAVHDWSRVEPGIFHDFHHGWISAIKRELNSGGLPEDHYAMVERWSDKREIDVLALQHVRRGKGKSTDPGDSPAIGVLPRPKIQDHVETEVSWYRRKKSHITVRHVSRDRVVALIEIVSAGNKSSKKAFQEFMDKAVELMGAKVHLLLIDVLPRTKRDPKGIHAAIWDTIADDPPTCAGKGALSAVAYEVVSTGVNAYCKSFKVGEALPDMPLFLDEDAQVPVSLERTYVNAFEGVAQRWRRVIEG